MTLPLFSRRQVLELAAGCCLPRSAIRVRPEYDRTLERILLSLPSRGTIEFWLPAFGDVLDALPAYTSIHLAARREHRDVALAISKRAGERAMQLHLVDEPDVEIELWAQDLGEPILVRGQSGFLVGSRMIETMGEPGKMSRDRKRVAEFLFGPDAVVEADFVFEGGNLAFDTDRGSPRVLVGYGDVERTMTDHAHRNDRVSRGEVRERMAAAFGGSEVVEMGTERQSPYLQHLDQAFVLLKDRIAVIGCVSDGGVETERRQLETYAAQLRELGYDLAFLEHTAEAIRRYWTSVNAVPFIDRITGTKRVIYPVFPEEVDGSEAAFTERALRGKGKVARDLFRDLGYEPIPVRDLTHVLGGNTHCIVNVLA